MPSVRRVLLVSGSLRARSTNSAVLRAAGTLDLDGIETMLSGHLAVLPPFNPDDEVGPLPAAVADLRDEIHRADALLFSVPEYAGGLPGSFKNLLDWLIGDDQPGSIHRKPVAWINASPRGAVLAHDSLRTVLGYAQATIVEAACAHLPVTAVMLDDTGLIGDPSVSNVLARSLKALAAHRR